MEYDAWLNVKDELLVLGVSVRDMDKIGYYYGRSISYMEEKHHLRIGRQTKEEKWLMPHIRPGCCVDYGVGRILFAGEVAGFLNFCVQRQIDYTSVDVIALTGTAHYRKNRKRRERKF